MYMRNSSKKRKYLIVKLFGTRSCDGSLYVCSCRYNGCINRRDVHISYGEYLRRKRWGFGQPWKWWPNPTLEVLFPSNTDSKKWLIKILQKLHGPGPK